MKRRRFLSAVVAGVLVLSLFASNATFAAADTGSPGSTDEKTETPTTPTETSEQQNLQTDTQEDPGTVTYAADPEAAENADSGSTIINDDTVTTDDVTNSIVMDKETGKEALDDNGNKVTAEARFRAEKSSGTVTVAYEFSGVKRAGKTLVSFETLSWNGHADEDRHRLQGDTGLLHDSADGL